MCNLEYLHLQLNDSEQLNIQFDQTELRYPHNDLQSIIIIHFGHTDICIFVLLNPVQSLFQNMDIG